MGRHKSAFSGPTRRICAAAKALQGLVHGVADTDGAVHVLVITEPRKGRKGEWLAYGTYTENHPENKSEK